MKLDEYKRSLLLGELMDCVDDLVLIVDSRLRVLEANRRAIFFFGYPAADLLRKNLLLLIDADERERMSALALGAEERRGDETVFLTRSNARMQARISISPLRGNGAKPQGYLIVGNLVDKEKITLDTDASNGLETRMLRGFASPLFIVDGPSRIVRDCNEAALITFGFSRVELLGWRLMDIARTSEERQLYRAMEERADKAYATTGIFQERVSFPRKNAPPLPCDLTSIPLFRPDGTLDSIIAMLFDRSIEEEREAELVDLIGKVSGLAAELANTASDYSTRNRAKSLSDLGFTSRQIEIARLAESGASSKEIGFRLGITESTVKNHLAVMYRKLGVNSRIGFMSALAGKRIKIE